MESLFDRHRRLTRKVQAIVLIACLVLMAVVVVMTLRDRSDEPETYTGRVDYDAPVAVTAPDGRVLESYKDGHFDQSVLFLDFVPEEIRIRDTDGATMWSMKGYVVNSLFWSPDGRYAAVSYRTEERGTTVVVDTSDWTETELTPPAEAQGAQVYFYAVSWDESGLRLCWDYGNKKAAGETLWNP